VHWTYSEGGCVKCLHTGHVSAVGTYIVAKRSVWLKKSSLRISDLETVPVLLNVNANV